jgi:hypothetical protein
LDTLAGEAEMLMAALVVRWDDEASAWPCRDESDALADEDEDDERP